MLRVDNGRDPAQRPHEKARKQYENGDRERNAEYDGNNRNYIHQIDLELFRKPFLNSAGFLIVPVAVYGGGTHKRFRAADKRGNEIYGTA